MTVFSKPVTNPGKSPAHMDTRFRAPIPLILPPEQQEVKSTNDETIKLKLRRNPAQHNSATYEKTFTVWDGKSVESYCHFRDRLQEIIVAVPLNTPQMKFGQMNSLVKGTAKSHWNTVVSNLQPGDAQSDAGWNNALQAFTRKNCSSNARLQQYRFMMKKMGLVSGMSVTDFWDRISLMQRFLTYLPAPQPTKYMINKDQLCYILVSAMPEAIDRLLQEQLSVG